MTPTTTAGPRLGLGILGIAALALVTIASGTMAQSPAPPSPAARVASPQPRAAQERVRRIDACRRVRERGVRPFGQGERRDRVRLRQRDLRRWPGDRPARQRDLRRWPGDRPARQRQMAVRRALRSTARVASVSAIEGTTLTLVTPDGWSLTVDTAGIPIIRGGAAISVADLRVGERVRVRQRRADDGTWQVTRIRALLTTLRGTVASVTDDGFELTTRDRQRVSVRVSDATRWILGCRVDPADPLAVGARVWASGVSAADGSLDATTVVAAGPPLLRGQELPEPVASPAPVASPSG
jgi:hypothetical protein